MAREPSANNPYILGLDIGTSSIGWTLVRGRSNPESIIDMGVRIFPEGMDRTRGEKSLNTDRRIARSLRRQTYRRQRRKTRLLHRLIEVGLLPEDEEQRQQLWRNTNPYELRAKALTQPLPPHELGRALYHLGQRRGYLSNRKTGNDKEDGAVAEGISAIDTAMREGNHPTLGAYLYHLQQSSETHDERPQKTAPRIRGQYTARRMSIDEFDAIWKAQQELGASLPSAAKRKAIWHAIFDQRPLKIQKHLVGVCHFETDRKRAQAATLAAQEFRLLQSLNNLKVSHGGEPPRWLSDTERSTLYQYLAERKQITWSKARDLLGFHEDSEFNLERVRGKNLQGNITAALISSAIGKPRWKTLDPRRREQLVYELLSIEDEDTLNRRLLSHWAFEVDTIKKLTKNSRQFPNGYMHLSHKAIRNLLPHMHRCYQELTPEEQQKLQDAGRELPPTHCGVRYSDAAVLAGYHHSHQSVDGTATLLPFPGKAAHHGSHAQISEVAVYDMRNPMVERALYQLRNVVNAIIHEYGMPAVIRLEMARDLKKNRRQREEYQKQQKENEQANDQARKKLEEYLGYPPSRNDVLKYRLWIECKRECPYTGKSITMDSLFGDNPQFDIEHIIPYSRCLNNGQINKTLCEKKENSRKGERTPYEMYANSPQHFEAIKQRVKRLPLAKRQRFWQEEVDPDAFVSQQLNETRYIARQARDYLKQLNCQVEGVNSGQLTAILRRAWNLNGLLSENGEKSRLDHRHHAVDALVVALTTPYTVKQLNRYASTTDGARLRFHDYPEPMPNLREQARRRLDRLIVSHKPQRKIKGPLHEDTFYGLTGEAHKGVPEIVIRKPLAQLTKPKQLEAIRDERIRHLAQVHIKKHNGDMKAAFQNPEARFGMTTKNGQFRPICKVRLVGNRSVQAVGKSPRHVWTRSNHHIAIFEVDNKNGQPVWTGKPVSMLDVAQRNKAGLTLVNKTHPSGGRFIMALHKDDLVSFKHNGKDVICRVVKMDQQGRITFRMHYDADKEDRKRSIEEKRVEPLRKMGLRKIKINVLGHITDNEQTDH